MPHSLWRDPFLGAIVTARTAAKFEITDKRKAPDLHEPLRRRLQDVRGELHGAVLRRRAGLARRAAHATTSEKDPASRANTAASMLASMRERAASVEDASSSIAIAFCSCGSGGGASRERARHDGVGGAEGGVADRGGVGGAAEARWCALG